MNTYKIVRNLEKAISKQDFKESNTDVSDDKNDGCEHMNWDEFHRLDVIHAFLDELEYNYPSICTVGVIGSSLEGRDLKVLRISNSNANNSAVWMDAGIHAREWIAPAVATYIIDHIVRNFDSLPASITNKDWYFHPVVNPDGYEYSHTVDRMWRKNRAWYGGRCVGVDLNRNFSYGWGGKGSSDSPTNAFFRGPKPFSEPESCAIRVNVNPASFSCNVPLIPKSCHRRWTQRLNCKQDILFSEIPFKVYITLHSFGQVILFPFAYRDELCPDYVRLLEGATAMSKAIYDTSGKTYKVGISRDVMYGAAGTSNDFSYGQAGIPFCYLIELRSKQHKFRLPEEEIEDNSVEILNAVKALMEFVDKCNMAEFPSLSQYLSLLYCFQNFSCLLNIFHINNISHNNNLHNTVKVATVYQKSQVWEIRFTNEGQRYFIKSLDTLGAINIWKEGRSTMDIMVEGPRSVQLADMLQEREIPYAVAIADIGVILDKQQGNSIKKTISYNNTATMDWKSYHRLGVIYAFMDDLAAQYPYLCTVSVIGKSVEGRDLRVLKISNGNTGNAGVWIDAAIHPREWISTAVVTYLANHIGTTFHEQPDCVTNKDWYFLPVLNPDGYEYTHTHDRMWRKNRAPYGECVGVDLNRNFSYGWGEKGEEGSSEDPGNIFFRGSKPFSEPETAAVKHAILDSETSFKVFLSFHSYGEVIIFPWGYTADPCPDYVELLEGGTAMAKAIFDSSGHTYKVGSTKDLMYFASGNSTDWSYGVANIPYSYMIELRGKTHRFLLPKEEILSSAEEVTSGVLRLMRFVDTRTSSTESCACSNV